MSSKFSKEDRQKRGMGRGLSRKLRRGGRKILSPAKGGGAISVKKGRWLKKKCGGALPSNEGGKKGKRSLPIVERGFCAS